MEQPNYKMPFNPKSVMSSNGVLQTCDMGESIAQNIMLLITTKKGENRYDENYGNEVWNTEFDNGISPSVWESIFIKSLRRQILDYEQRLVNPEVEAHISIVEHTYETRNLTEIKKKVRVTIRAKLEATGENFNFATELFLSPMSID
ncbi:Gene 25-like lysozyme [Chryseobacterium taklimakanense]|uniref:Gene 25-like lysozyme n=1 Tax=Chryseobacterium taklimakanense TaxID=536441 RepID=A0A239WKQ4_9FLAO|nr:GPW/gp25 family protein [Chryseobacterium taklimakanense]SNV34779.1 Gene 25-like lysozyme [Chryseobacterium taklimakanense]